MIAADADAIIAAVPALKPYRAEIAGRAMLCRRGTVFPIECVVRGYLSGSAWREYAKQGTLAGETLQQISEPAEPDRQLYAPDARLRPRLFRRARDMAIEMPADLPAESISLSYGTIVQSYTQQAGPGVKEEVFTSGWDVIGNLQFGDACK